MPEKREVSYAELGEFEPYIKDLNLPWKKYFLFGTRQAQRWYDPLPEHYRYELEWLHDNIDFGPGRIFIDGGCHHGLYGVALANGCIYYGIDLHQPNLDLTRANCALNGIDLAWGRAAIANQIGRAKCLDAALGVLDDDGESVVDTVRVCDIHSKPHIVKLDIEGAEFLVLPEALDQSPSVDTWIVEVHPWMYKSLGEKDIFTPFIDHGFTLYYIDRNEDKPVARLMKGEITWTMQSTMIALKR